jgi:hypothetical protein
VSIDDDDNTCIDEVAQEEKTESYGEQTLDMISFLSQPYFGKVRG